MVKVAVTGIVCCCDVVSVHGAHIAVALSEAEHVTRQVSGCIDADRLQRHRHEVDAQKLRQDSEVLTLLYAGEDESEFRRRLGLHKEALVAGEVDLSEECGGGARPSSEGAATSSIDNPLCQPAAAVDSVDGAEDVGCVVVLEGFRVTWLEVVRVAAGCLDGLQHSSQGALTWCVRVCQGSAGLWPGGERTQEGLQAIDD